MFKKFPRWFWYTTSLPISFLIYRGLLIFLLLALDFEQQQCYCFEPSNSLLGELFYKNRTCNSIFGLCSLDPSSVPPVVMSKMFPDIARYLLESKIHLMWTTVLEQGTFLSGAQELNLVPGEEEKAFIFIWDGCILFFEPREECFPTHLLIIASHYWIFNRFVLFIAFVKIYK